MPKSIIEELNTIRGLQIECPNCGEPFSPRAAHLFSVKNNLPSKIQKFLHEKNNELAQGLKEIKEQRKSLRAKGEKRPKQIKVTTEAVNFGKIVEKIIPSFGNFPYNSEDCRALYDPISLNRP